MTAAQKLRLEHAALKVALETARQRLRDLEHHTRCIYCGDPTKAGSKTCRAHADLLDTDDA